MLPTLMTLILLLLYQSTRDVYPSFKSFLVIFRAFACRALDGALYAILLSDPHFLYNV